MIRSSSISCRTRIDPRAGFTLIEVLAGLFVTGLFVMTVLPFVTRLVGGAWSGEANMVTADEWMQASARLAADFGEAVPLSTGDGSKPGIAFRASSNRIEFVHRSLAGDRAHLEIVTETIESDSEGQTLARSSRPYGKDAFTDDSDADHRGQPIVLLKTPFGLRFKVRGADNQPLTVGSNPKQLPSEVELDVDGGEAFPSIPFVFPVVARSNPLTAIAPEAAE
jgi:hypothetical protein